MTWAPLDPSVTNLNLVGVRVETPWAVYPAGHLVWVDGEAQIIDDASGGAWETLTVTSVERDGRRWRFEGRTADVDDEPATWEVDGTTRPCCGATGSPIPK